MPRLVTIHAMIVSATLPRLFAERCLRSMTHVNAPPSGCKWPTNTGGHGTEYLKALARGYRSMKFLDPLHPNYGAAQCPDAHVFLDGDGGPDTELALDVVSAMTPVFVIHT